MHLASDKIITSLFCRYKTEKMGKPRFSVFL